MESYVYVPVKLTINVEQFQKGDIARIYQENEEEFEEEDEHFVLIFFVAYQMSLGEKSFWYPYFEIAADSDLPMSWPEMDMTFLEDETLKMSI